MRYYIENTLDIRTIKNKLKQYLKKVEKTNIFLSNFGLLKYINKDLFIFKINNNEDICEVHKKYFKDFNIISSSCLWKKQSIKHQIPFDGHKISLNIYTYTLSEKHNVSFVIEEYGNNYVDYYFKSQEDDINNLFLKNDICSFLEIIN